ncbi:LysE family transporter [uncultured Polaribacter sp.]|uniref:LysE family transporter n=1 Tax=uncultured Polaribacter sp. TaxID=174711 RepID=UPI002606BAE2|nr:LysE family transporter [uncultured Polaribacter sp.]
MISIFVFGFVFSFLGYTPPSVLNMTALKIKLKEDKREFNKFIIGVLLVVFLQAYLSIYLTNYLSNNPIFLELLNKTGIIVLFFLSFYFFKKNKKEKQEQEVKQNIKNSLLTGITLSILNMFAIPFFSGIVLLLATYNLMSFDTISILFFVVGSVFGTFFILNLYGKYAFVIQQKTGNLTNNINLILCFITAGFGLFTLLKFVI